MLMLRASVLSLSLSHTRLSTLDSRFGNSGRCLRALDPLIEITLSIDALFAVIVFLPVPDCVPF